MSGPRGSQIPEEECMAIIENLPPKLDRITLSGGEPLAEGKLLYKILDRLEEKYRGQLFIAIQTNGDLLNDKNLDTLIEKGVGRFSIAGIDRYHKKQGARKEELSRPLFEAHGGRFLDGQPSQSKTELKTRKDSDLTYSFFGADEDMWLGGNWARGRAMQKKSGSGMEAITSAPLPVGPLDF